MNAFESGARKAIPAVLVYVRSGERMLMIHRNVANRGDYHEGKWNGLGGKCEPDESPLQTAMRELREESGLELPETAFRPLGAIQFPNFKAHKSEDWIVFVFDVHIPTEMTDRVMKKSGEGELHWISDSEVMSLNLWAGDRHFMHYVLQGRPFVGTIWYRGGEVVQQWVTALK